MIEEEWIASTDARTMLSLLRGKASRRKLGLWVVAIYRQAVLKPGRPFVDAVDVLER